MELACIEGPIGTGDKKIILPNVISLESLSLFQFENGEEKPQKENADYVENAKQIDTKRLDSELDITEIANSVNKNIEYVKEKLLFFIGDGDKKVFLGVVLRVVSRGSYSKINDNKLVHFDENPLNERGKFVHMKDKEIAITPANEDGKDLIILVFKNGCVIVAAGGYLVFNIPIVVVKSNGNYFTISGGPRNGLLLKTGVHVILLAKLDKPVPIVLMRGPQEIRQRKLEPKVSEVLEKPLVKPEVEIEKLVVSENEFTETKYIPKNIIFWINVKGYELEKSLLGIGPYSIVRRGKRISDSKPIAVKIIVSKMDEIAKRKGKPPQELLIAKKVIHQNITKTFDTFCVTTEIPKRTETMFSLIVMELGTTDRLDKMIKREGKLSEDKSQQIFQQIASAVAYLHINYIAHCNVRLDNCLVFDNNIIKLCDFSRAENIFLKLDDSKSQKYSSLKYMPPEIFETENCDLLKVDIWMSGCLLYGLMSANTSPFGDINPKDQMEKTETFNTFIKRQKDGLMSGGLDFNISDKGKDLLIQMFKIDPNDRINSRQVLVNDWLK